MENNICKFFLQALVNMGEILKAAGCGYDNGKENLTIIIIIIHLPHCHHSLVVFFFAVVKATVLLADINDFNAVNDVYKQCKCHYFYIILLHQLK